MGRKLLSLLILASASLFADNCCIDSCDCNDCGPKRGHFAVRHREPNGIGYSKGYTSLDIFYAPDIGPCWRPFFDGRYHVFNDGHSAFNAGVGLRYLSECYDVIYGGNIYWDYRHARHRNFHQVGLGLEALWPCWDLRLDGYIPVHSKKNYRTGFSHFEGNSAIVSKKYELNLGGFDLTLGYWIYRCGWLGVHAALGGYYRRGDFGIDAGGGLFQAKVRIFDYVTLEGQVSYDNRFNWIGQGELGIRIPLGRQVSRYQRKIPCCETLLALEERIAQEPERFEIIVTTTHAKTAVATNALTGQDLRFIFVNNLSGSNGTFEDPYATLIDAQMASQPGDMIYVFPGDGTDNGMNAGITLQDGQFFAGSGAPVGVGSSFGGVLIPRQTQTKPKISNAGGAAVTAANKNLISGFGIEGDTGILAIDIEGLAILNNDIDVDSAGIISTPTGRVVIENNNFQVVSGDALDVGVTDSFATIANNVTNRDFIVNLRKSDLDTLVFEENHINGCQVQILPEGGKSFALVRNTMIDTTDPTKNSFLFSANNGSDVRSIVTNIAGTKTVTPVITVSVEGQSEVEMKFYNNETVPMQFGTSFAVEADSRLFLESPNSAVSGFRAINTSDITFDDSGNPEVIEFIPFD